ncbi:hypothetical protein L1765_11235 [Microaerobacter geothermalis]|uniref:hypothetical protein n=1 Tax=Microaerobacter geothermalis TaxID=674972 RepID=UPI001F1DE31C|nr:hypothetical protein [Microaerobacter geothermalis]MCF6094536.1 hypothetical protein [Microaerobacter geothermalis]
MLPDILDIAKKHGLSFDSRSLGKKEVRTKCPFCLADIKRRDKYYLSLNTIDQVFKCWYCGESGGVFRFISLLTKVPEHEVVQMYQRENGRETGKKKYKYKLHPAEKLTTTQLKMLGYLGKPNWAELRKRDKDYYKRTRSLVLNEWNDFLQWERYEAFQLLIVGIHSFSYQKAIESIRDREREIGAPLLEKVLQVYSLSKWPEWAKEAEKFALEFCKNKPLLTGHKNKSAAR